MVFFSGNDESLKLTDDNFDFVPFHVINCNFRGPVKTIPDQNVFKCSFF